MNPTDQVPRQIEQKYPFILSAQFLELTVGQGGLLYFEPMTGFVVRLGGSGNFYCVIICFFVVRNFNYKHIVLLCMRFDSSGKGPMCSKVE